MPRTFSTGLAWVLVLLLAGLLAATPATLAQGSLEADYEVRVETDHAEAGPQETVRFPIVIENRGDERVRFVFQQADPGGAGGAQVVVPAPVELEGASTGGPSTATVTLMVFTPFKNGYVDEEQEVTLTVVPQDPEDPDRQGEPTMLTVSVHTEGFYIPGPGGALVVTIAGLAALGVGRRWRG